MMLSRLSETSPYQDSIVNDCVYYQDKAAQADAWLEHVILSDPGYSFDKSAQVLSQCPFPEHTNITGAPCFYGWDYEAQFNSLPIKGGKQIKKKKKKSKKLIYNNIIKRKHHIHSI